MRVIADITRPCHLNPERRDRSYPRVVKRARPNSYPVKRAHHTGTRHDGPPTITLITRATPSHTMINTS